MFYSFRIKKSCAFAVLGAAVTALALGTCFAGNQEDYCCTAEVLSAVSTALPAAENIESGERTAYLSFDDGPSATTESVLNTLKGKGVPATFFVCAAENNEPYLPLLARTAAEGHQIGLHSCSHSYKTIYASPEAFWSDLDLLWEKISPYVSEKPTCMRFPGGSTNTVSRRYGGSGIMTVLKSQAEERGLRYFDWNNCPGDALGEHPSAETLTRRVLGDLGGRRTIIVLLHDTGATKSTAAALPDIIDALRAQGYRFDLLKNYPVAPSSSDSTAEQTSVQSSSIF